MFFLYSEGLHILLYDVSPSLLPSSSTAASVELCRHDSFHEIFVFYSHHTTIASQSGLSYFASNVCHQSVFLMTSLLFLSFSETPCIHRSILISVLSSSPSSLLVIVQASAPYISTGLIIDLYTFSFRYLAF